MNYDAAGLTEFDIRQMSITFKYSWFYPSKIFTIFYFIIWNKFDWFSKKNVDISFRKRVFESTPSIFWKKIVVLILENGSNVPPF